MKIICLTQRPIQTLVLIYLLGKNNIFFDQIIYCSLNKKKKTVLEMKARLPGKH